ncbi:Neu5Ac permease [Thalassovita gelatinovora]|uniref:TRAP transporter large permease protein n=1 Tax=Thalassovita gelatinovora TaxID=53501 RepID=A0A0P1G707_THAGE|nr:TRAP transporter large permease [Thalassovita gelatinovora]QIZ81601.1 TRAP transporter large permease [Thalassovita gelatinovora]CUH68048.1 Neu5Ac permease [Thalassovita gelatinovora]SEQ28238.1 TRAP transporter, DctM subunit [Thalassovita gelatinovora]
MTFMIFAVLGLLMLLVLMGVHLAVALGTVSFIGVTWMMGSVDIGFSILSTTAYEALRKDIFIIIPLFVLMGDFVSRSGSANDLYALCNRAFRRLPGCLGVATVAGNAIFAAITGVSIAAAATFSRIAYPEMVALGYSKRFSLGTVAGSACLGMLIPPSILMIVWAVLTEQSIGALFIAGLVPGLLLAAAFCVYCVIYALRHPDCAPCQPAPDPSTQGTALLLRQSLGGLSILGLIAVVIGGIWGGFLTPTEAAGFGAIGAFLIGLAKGMTWRDAKDAIYSAGRTTAPIMILLIAASMYSRFLAMGGATQVIGDLLFSVSESPIVVLGIIFTVWILLGMFIDSTSIILLTVPIFAPVATTIGLDPLAFAIFGILVIEAGLLTPPFGIIVFTVKAAVPDPDVELADIFKGAIPFWILILAVAVLCVAFPQLCTWLPENFM